MIAVDTNVIAYLLLPGERSEHARLALRRDPAWAAPLLWRSELRSVLVQYVRAGHLPLSRATELAATAEELLHRREFAVRSADILALAEHSGRSACDCEFIALAEDLDVPLVTSDRKLLGSFPRRAIPLEQYARGH